MDTWELIKTGSYEEAIKQADEIYKSTGDVLALRNKLYALFHLKKYDECILLSNQIIELQNGETDSDLIFLGISSWLLDKKVEAITAWKRGEGSKFKDGAGGIELQVFLYFAAIKTGDQVLRSEVLKKIVKILKGKRAINWPGPLGRYLQKDLDEAELLSYVMTIPILKERQLCQAHLAIAIRRLEYGLLDDYRKELKMCTSFGPNAYLEQMYYLAKGELETDTMEH